MSSQYLFYPVLFILSCHEPSPLNQKIVKSSLLLPPVCSSDRLAASSSKSWHCFSGKFLGHPPARRGALCREVPLCLQQSRSQGSVRVGPRMASGNCVRSRIGCGEESSVRWCVQTVCDEVAVTGIGRRGAPTLPSRRVASDEIGRAGASRTPQSSICTIYITPHDINRCSYIMRRDIISNIGQSHAGIGLRKAGVG